MRTGITVAALAALVLAGTLRAQQKPQDVALQAAIRSETVSGDLRKAIAQYQEIVDRYSKTDRAAAANALMRMADCYQKLGDQQARALFERVVREFGDQKQAAEAARARLAKTTAMAGRPGMVNKQVWVGNDVDIEGTISPDGRFLSYVHWDTGDLAIRDLAAGTSRRLTRKGTWTDSSDFAEESSISRDGQQVVYSWFNEKTGQYDLRVLRTDAVPGTPPKVIFSNIDVDWLAPYDWSPDGKSVAVQMSRRDRTTQIGIVSVADGSFKPLRSVDWRGTSRLSFSPDASLLAYDLSESESNGREIFLLRVDGSRQTPVAPHPGNDVVVGWSPDGSSFLFASDRNGTTGLWSVAIVNGEPSGKPMLLKPELGSLPFSLGISRTGALLYGVRVSASTVAIASVDLESGELLTGPTLPFETYANRISSPDWSPDGRLLAVVEEVSRTRPGLTIATAEGKRLRQVGLSMAYAQRLRWATDGYVTVQGTDLKGRQGIFRINPDSGEVSPLALSDPATGTLGQPAWTPDGKVLVFRRNGSKSVQFVAREIATSQERILLEGVGLAGLSLSTDGTRIAYIQSDREKRTSSVMMLPLSGGTPTEVARIPGAVRNFTQWAVDDRHILFESAIDLKTALWSISTTGSAAPRRIAVGDLDNSSIVRIHPDGRQIAYGTGSNVFEVWTLENFLPRPAATSTRR
jgi:Tol biopolymer transport system component